MILVQVEVWYEVHVSCHPLLPNQWSGHKWLTQIQQNPTTMNHFDIEKFYGKGLTTMSNREIRELVPLSIDGLYRTSPQLLRRMHNKLHERVKWHHFIQQLRFAIIWTLNGDGCSATTTPPTMKNVMNTEELLPHCHLFLKVTLNEQGIERFMTFQEGCVD